MEDVLGIGHEVTRLVNTYVRLAREELRDEARAVGRRTAIAAALLVVFSVGTVLLAVGLSRIVERWLEVEGIGPVVVGGLMIITVPAAAYLMLKRRS